MSNKRKRYREEFKRQIVELKEHGKRVSEISSEYGIAEAMIYRWVKLYGTMVTADDGQVVTVAEIRKLKKKVSQLEMENEILKKQQPYSPRNKIGTHKARIRELSHNGAKPSRWYSPQQDI